MKRLFTTFKLLIKTIFLLHKSASLHHTAYIDMDWRARPISVLFALTAAEPHKIRVYLVGSRASLVQILLDLRSLLYRFAGRPSTALTLWVISGSGSTTNRDDEASARPLPYAAPPEVVGLVAAPRQAEPGHRGRVQLPGRGMPPW